MRIYNRRLAALEIAVRSASECSVVARMVQDGKLYDKLNDSEKTAYSAYWGTPRAVIEEIELAVNGSLNFPLRLKPNEPLVKIVNEVEKLVTEM